MQKLLFLVVCLFIYSSCSENALIVPEDKIIELDNNYLLEDNLESLIPITSSELLELQELTFTDSEESTGKEFANNFIKIIDAVNKYSVDISDKGQYFSFVETNILQNEGDMSDEGMSELIDNGLVNLTENQNEILILIKEIFENNGSYDQIMSELLNLVTYVKSTFAVDEQQTMILRISNVYFTVSKLRDLENNGMNFSSNRWSIASLWAAALLEPTPFGEIIAGLVTAGFAIYLIKERLHCINSYVHCIQNTTGSNCSDCLHFCVSQGYWNC